MEQLFFSGLQTLLAEYHASVVYEQALDPIPRDIRASILCYRRGSVVRDAAHLLRLLFCHLEVPMRIVSGETFRYIPCNHLVVTKIKENPELFTVPRNLRPYKQHIFVRSNVVDHVLETLLERDVIPCFSDGPDRNLIREAMRIGRRKGQVIQEIRLSALIT
jgi:hypothetical protein